MNPLVLTVELDAAVQARFDAERARLFPPGRTQVGAHITLFHALPGAAAEALIAELTELAHRPPLDLAVTGLMPLGSGVAYRIESTALHRLHSSLQRRWHDQLSRQDQQGFRPHITVQNKVDAATARRTLIELNSNFEPFTITARGLALWDYLAGRWQLRAGFPFAAKVDPD